MSTERERLEAVIEANRERLLDSVRRGEQQLADGELVSLDDLLGPAAGSPQ